MVDKALSMQRMEQSCSRETVAGMFFKQSNRSTVNAISYIRAISSGGFPQTRSAAQIFPTYLWEPLRTWTSPAAAAGMIQRCTSGFGRPEKTLRSALGTQGDNHPYFTPWEIRSCENSRGETIVDPSNHYAKHSNWNFSDAHLFFTDAVFTSWAGKLSKSRF